VLEPKSVERNEIQKPVRQMIQSTLEALVTSNCGDVSLRNYLLTHSVTHVNDM